MGTSKRWLSFVVFVAFACTPVVVVAPDAGASIPFVTGYCGMSVVSSIRLANDLSCTGAAIQTDRYTTGNPIVIDLRGHTIASTSTDMWNPVFLQSDPGPPGEMFSSTTLRNGRVEGPTGATLGPGEVFFSRIVFDGGGITAIAGYGGRVTVEHSKFINGAAISSDQEDLISKSNRFIAYGSSRVAIGLHSGRAVVTDTTISGYEIAISTSGVGQYPQGGVTVDLEQNHIIGNDMGMQFVAPSSVSGTVTKNTLRSNEGDGIFIGVGSTLTLSANVMSHNERDGIRVDPSPVGTERSINLTLTGNRATLNAGWGIESTGSIPPDITVIDGGGNRANANHAGQCLNITCT